MNGYGLAYKSTVCNPKFDGSKFVAVFIFMKLYQNNCILL